MANLLKDGLVLEERPLMFQEVVAGTLYQYASGAIKAEVLAFEDSLRLRLPYLGFVEEEDNPNTYWYRINKEAKNG